MKEALEPPKTLRFKIIEEVVNIKNYPKITLECRHKLKFRSRDREKKNQKSFHDFKR